jgi:hypothetical protein
LQRGADAVRVPRRDRLRRRDQLVTANGCEEPVRRHRGGALAIVDSHSYPQRPLDIFNPTLTADDYFLIPSYDIGLYYSGGNFQPGPGGLGFTTSLVRFRGCRPALTGPGTSPASSGSTSTPTALGRVDLTQAAR